MWQWRRDRTSGALGNPILPHGQRQSGGEARRAWSKLGQPLGRVGLSGLTEYPHLHFTVRHKGAVVDPFAYGARCRAPAGAANSLWHPALHAQLAYQERAILNAGFASGPVTMELIEDGSAEPGIAVCQLGGDRRFCSCHRAEDGRRTMARSSRIPSDNVIAENRACTTSGQQGAVHVVCRQKASGGRLGRGTYKATYVVERDGRVVLQERPGTHALAVRVCQAPGASRGHGPIMRDRAGRGGSPPLNTLFPPSVPVCLAG